MIWLQIIKFINDMDWLKVIGIITNLAIVGTFFFYRRQLSAMQGQLETARLASQSQNILTVINFLQQSQVHDARRTLIGLTSIPFEQWTLEERTAVDKACGSYDVAGILVKQGIVPKEIIIDNWGDSIKKCHNAAEPLIAEYRKPDQRGPNFWDDFEWLYHEVEKSPLWKWSA
jgi:hypothetical protein